jgi:hypothetical protein
MKIPSHLKRKNPAKNPKFNSTTTKLTAKLMAKIPWFATQNEALFLRLILVPCKKNSANPLVFMCYHLNGQQNNGGTKSFSGKSDDIPLKRSSP